MDTHRFQAVVIGGGIAGATAAAHLARHLRVALIEAEDAAGYHTTGRSAAIWIGSYGTPDAVALTLASERDFREPAPGFGVLAAPRDVLHLAPDGQDAALARTLAAPGVREITPAQARARLPALREGYAHAAALETGCFDLDVAALHQGYLRLLREQGGTVALAARATRLLRMGRLWRIVLATGEVLGAEFVVNAAGAWADEVARSAGVTLIGLQPKRRTALIVDPAPFDCAAWPLAGDAGHSWYARPEARSKLLLSPADETDSEPCDARPDELDIALAIDRAQQALAIEVTRVEHAWAGLRSFTPDRSLAIGEARDAPGFFWMAGQGGYGIQTAPAAGRLLAGVVLDALPADLARIAPLTDPNRFARPAA
jgi:D-arginine dehydrogenase